MWTQFFFILAGFVLGYVEMAKPLSKHQTMTTLRYIRKRLTTTYPLYAVSLLFFVMKPVHGRDEIAGTSGLTQLECKWVQFPLAVTLLQAVVQLDCAPPQWNWNGPCWFLSALLVYWAMLQPLANFFRRISLRAAWCCMIILWLASFVLVLFNDLWESGRRDSLYWTNPWLTHGPLGYLHVFISGVVSARIFILTCTRDEHTGEPPKIDFKRITLSNKHVPHLFRYGCLIGYALYCVLLPFWAIYGHADWPAPGSLKYESYLFLHNGGLMPIMSLILVSAAAGMDPLSVAFRSPRFSFWLVCPTHST
jgi:hypothetical protein